jgi:hypothetical protein
LLGVTVTWSVSVPASGKLSVMVTVTVKTPVVM